METHNNIGDLPDWLDQNMFAEFLQRDFENFKTIKQFEVEETCGKGENFTTLVLRVKILVELKGKIFLMFYNCNNYKLTNSI